MFNLAIDIGFRVGFLIFYHLSLIIKVHIQQLLSNELINDQHQVIIGNYIILI